MAARASVAGGGRLIDRIRKWYYNAAGFNKLGLMRDDTLYEDDDVKEALKRLPEDVYNERIFRIKRALDLSLKHRILPKDQWVKYEEPANNFPGTSSTDISLSEETQPPSQSSSSYGLPASAPALYTPTYFLPGEKPPPYAP